MKIAKIIAVIAAICIALGLVITGSTIAIAAGSGTDTPFENIVARLNTTEWKKISDSISADGIRKITIDDSNMEINIVETKGDSINITAFESEFHEYTFTNIDGEISIIGEEIPFKRPLVNFDIRTEIHLTVEVPTKLGAELEIGTSNSSINIENIKNAGYVSAHSSNGSVNISNASMDNLRAKSSNSSINLNNVEIAGKAYADSSNSGIRFINGSCEELTVSTSNSAITVENATVAQMLKADNSNGNITIERTECGKLDTQTSNSSIKIENATVAELLKADNSNGSITIEGSKCGEMDADTSNSSLRVFDSKARTNITLKNSNGGIKHEDIYAGGDIYMRSSNSSIAGTIDDARANYTITSETSNSANDLGSGGNGSKKLNVKNSNGSIKIDFTENTENHFDD